MFQSVALNFGLNLFFVLVCPWLAMQLYPLVSPYAMPLGGKPSFGNDLFNAIGALGHLRESGIALASTLSTAWQSWALSRAVRARLDDQAEPALTRDFALMTFGSAIASSFLGVYLYRQFSSPDSETLYGFGLGAAAFLAPPIYIGYEYFHKRFDAVRERLKLRPDESFPDDEVPETLKLQYAVYTSLSASLIMGLIVWACRESLPPEAASFGQALQRAVVPVGVGIVAYCVAAGTLVSREYDELKTMVARRFKRKSSSE
jgi:hypothetical protein